MGNKRIKGPAGPFFVATGRAGGRVAYKLQGGQTALLGAKNGVLVGTEGVAGAEDRGPRTGVDQKLIKKGGFYRGAGSIFFFLKFF